MAQPNRRGIFAWLLGVPLAAQTQPGITGRIKVNEKPLNNQCPVCGAMAESLLLMPQYSISSANEFRFSGRDIILLSEGNVGDQPPKMPSRLIRCKRCNAAFWQDAEEAK